MGRIQQRVYISRRDLHSLEFDYDVIRIPLRVGEETSFEIYVINYGEPTHVHFSIGEEIRDKVMILQEKVYVIKEEKIAVITKLPKNTAGIGTIKGQIAITTGYGASKRAFTVVIEEIKEQMREERKRKKELKEVLPVESDFLFRIAISTAAIAFLFSSIFISFSLSSIHSSFFFSLLAAFLFLFLILYNL
ncbi:MAG: DUF7524 family protein [Candidatus Methanospirareceae archaeon]